MGKFDPAGYRFLLTGQPLDASGLKDDANPAPGWLQARAWSDIQRLSCLEQFAGLVRRCRLTSG